MSEQLESVKLPADLLAIYREWAKVSGRTLSGLITIHLRHNAVNFLDGQLAGAQRVAGAMEPKP